MEPIGEFIKIDKSYRSAEDLRHVGSKAILLEIKRVENIMRILFFGKQIDQGIVDSYNYFEGKWKILRENLKEEE